MEHASVHQSVRLHLAKELDQATMDLATLSYVYGAAARFIHGALIAESEGLDVARYGRLVNAISPSFGAFFEHEGMVTQPGDFAVTESPLRISVEATRRILQSSRQAGINSEIPALLTDLFARANAQGLGDEELASLIKVLRAPAPSQAQGVREMRAGAVFQDFV